MYQNTLQLCGFRITANRKHRFTGKAEKKYQILKHSKKQKKLGKSIEECPETVNLGEEFGHLEIDSVLGKKKATKPAIMTIVKRKTRMSLWIKIKDHSSMAIDEALQSLVNRFGTKKSEVFKCITGDNGSEFANLSNIENNGISVYFTHPYTSCEKGTNECHNKMLRQFIPKGKSIDDYSAEDILFFSDVINELPRKILNYHTPRNCLIIDWTEYMLLKCL